MKITTSTKTPDENQLKKINEVINRLVTEYGYTPASANEILSICGKFVKSLIGQKIVARILLSEESPCRSSLKGFFRLREVKSMAHPLFIVSEEDWSLHRKGYQDQMRHQEKVKEAIRENLPDLISEESIIMSDGKANRENPGSLHRGIPFPL